MDEQERFWSKVNKQTDSECWEWTAGRSRGYGTFTVEGKTVRAHRVAWMYLRGQIPEGLQIDHLCRNKACVNPDHLEPVTSKENVLRGMSPGVILHHQGVCKRGHALTEDNSYTSRKGTKGCRICKQASDKHWRETHRERENARYRRYRALKKAASQC